ncbi:rhodanese-like protein [Porphyromonas uenonis 60-3]|uniref:Rhodanese-like protein n=2 Tax=Porphyromonas uenonis TaxID=281920 RepID=C2MBM3_9PORP|nr:rhodanese-like protein [Porphyromonas uenonis 60-3]
MNRQFSHNDTLYMIRTLYYCIIMGVLSMLIGSCRVAREIKSVDAATFKAEVSSATVQLLDVRTADEFAKGHLEKSINIDVHESHFTEMVKERFDKSQPIYLYCRSGKRSMMAAQALAKEGYQIVNLKDGFLGWLDAGYPAQE